MELTERKLSENSTVNAAVLVRHACKSYSPANTIFNDFNFTVPEGNIYGLLGPSGCGKTTLLNCISGQISFDSGLVKLSIRRRVEMGYMPQTLSLHCSMTTLENFFFYGYLYGMETKLIQERATDYISLLDLPSGNRLLCDLSGGQQRRVSLAIAIFHDPKLIILDEPTVGLDPILSRSIWHHLIEMGKRGKTIIITTHYIQEARQADVIGLLRNGKLLAEESPDSLITKCNCQDLEEAFLKLSQHQETKAQETVPAYPKINFPTRVTFEEDNRTFSKKKLHGLMFKYATLMKREYTFLVLLIMLPFTMCSFFYVSAGRNPKNLRIAVINEEISIAECGYNLHTGCFLNESQTVFLSCLYLKLLRENSYNLVEYFNEAEAAEDMKTKKVYGIIHFHENYTHSLSQKFLYGAETDSKHLNNMNEDVWLDSSDFVISSLIKYDVTRLLQFNLRQAFAFCSENPKKGSIPLTFEKPIFGSENEEFISYTFSSCVVITCFFLPVLSTAVRLLSEKKRGILERVITAGVSINEILISIIIIEMLAYVVQYFVTFGVLLYIFEIPHNGNLITYTWLMLLTGISGVFLGLTLTAACKDVMLLGYSGMALNLTLAQLSGLLSSTEAAHYILKKINWLFPLYLTIEAARGISVKGFPLTHPDVIKGFAGTIIWGCIFSLAIFILVRHKRNLFIQQK